MKVISLNTWGGRAGREGLLRFFGRNSDADVFCLQEMWSAPYEHLDGRLAGGVEMKNEEIMVYGLQEISAALPGHRDYFRPHHLDNYGLAMFVSRGLDATDEGEVFVHKEKGHIPEGDFGNHARNIQYVTMRTPAGKRTVVNFHGLWNGRGKGDSEDRLGQSRKIIAFLQTLDHPFVLCGDFNLLPDTRSLKMLEEFGLRDLIREYGITSTRTSHYAKPEKFADYAFVSEGIDVKEFRVLPDEVSDHAPLFIEFE